jgi:hypothetical protein
MSISNALRIFRQDVDARTLPCQLCVCHRPEIHAYRSMTIAHAKRAGLSSGGLATFTCGVEYPRNALAS